MAAICHRRLRWSLAFGTSREAQGSFRDHPKASGHWFPCSLHAPEAGSPTQQQSRAQTPKFLKAEPGKSVRDGS